MPLFIEVVASCEYLYRLSLVVMPLFIEVISGYDATVYRGGF